MAKYEAEGPQIKVCYKLERKHEKMVYCKLRGRDVKVDDYIKRLFPRDLP